MLTRTGRRGAQRPAPVVQLAQDLRGRLVVLREGPQGRPELAHDRRSPGTAALHVADDDADPPCGQRDQVVPVAADLGLDALAVGLETHGQGIQTQVGGDWYDLIPLSAGRVGIVIGDVEGRGARAAAIMGQLRATLRAFAQDDKAPAEILRKLDDWCRTLNTTPAGAGDHFDSPRASCTYLVYDAWSRNLSFANAGHDAPLVVIDGEVAELEIEHHGVLLGVRGTGVAG